MDWQIDPLDGCEVLTTTFAQAMEWYYDPEWWSAGGAWVAGIATVVAAIGALLGYRRLIKNDKQRQEEIMLNLREQRRQADAMLEQNDIMKQQILTVQQRARVEDEKRRRDIMPHFGFAGSGSHQGVLILDLINTGKGDATEIRLDTSQVGGYHFHRRGASSIPPGQNIQIVATATTSHAIPFGITLLFQDMDRRNEYSQRISNFPNGTVVEDPVLIKSSTTA